MNFQRSLIKVLVKHKLDPDADLASLAEAEGLMSAGPCTLHANLYKWSDHDSIDDAYAKAQPEIRAAGGKVLRHKSYPQIDSYVAEIKFPSPMAAIQWFEKFSGDKAELFVTEEGGDHSDFFAGTDRSTLALSSTRGGYCPFQFK